ncbi:MAG: PAS domain S-box protein [Chitinophagaceae bacterium]|nr:MAG: PAS domain S-box protein [Chitinophagaceae bacterium]
MYNFSDTRFQNRLVRSSKYFVILIIASGILVLLGWQFDIEFFKRPFPHLVAMNPATAIAFICTGISFLLLTTRKKSISKFRSGTILAAVVIFIGIAKLVSFIPGVDFSIDLVLFIEKTAKDIVGGISNSMAPNTAACFVLTGLSLLLLNYETSRKQMPAHYISLFITGIGVLSLLGYLYGVRSFYGVMSYIPMALHTAICFILIAIAILFINPGRGVMKEFTSNYTGSYTARRIIPAVILTTILFGLIILYGHRSDWYSDEFGMAAFSLCIIITFLGVTWYNSRLLNRREVLKEETENALHESQEQVQAIFKGAPDAIIIIDEEGMIVQWNQQSEILFGWKAEEVTGKPLSEFFINHFRKAYKKALHHFVKTGESTILSKSIEIRALKKDNTEFDIALSISPTMLQNKFLFIGFIRDITERKKMEEQIGKFTEELERQVKEKTSQLNGIFERITDGFIALDKNFCYTYVNKKNGELVHRDPESLIGKNVWKEFPDAIGSATYQAFHESMKEQKYICNTDYYPQLDLWQENHIYPSPEGLSVFIRDVTERKRTEKEIADYKYALDQSSIVSVANQKGIITQVNENFCKISKYTEAELLGQDHRIINSEYHSKDYIKNLWTTIAKGQIWRGEFRNKAKDGSIYWVDSTIVPLLSSDGKPYQYLAILSDITERKKAEKQIIETSEQLRRLSAHLQEIREEERITIAREIHDELGQQLTVLKMDISWLNKKIVSQDEKILEKMRGLLGMVDETVKTVRRISSELRPGVLDDLGLEAALEGHSEEFEKRSGIVVKFLSEITNLKLKKNIEIGLFRIFQESLTNVARHAQASKVEVSLIIEKGNLLMQIKDNGKGFDPSSIGIKKTLGILGMRERTTIMGGEYIIHSSPGKGTVTEVKVLVSSST